MNESLKTARETLAAYEGDLPQFHALLSENEHAAEILKRARAPLDKQADAKARVTAARELLEQHASDIATARADVARLEAEAQRQSVLGAMLAHANRAQGLRERFDAELQTTVTQLEKRLDTLRGLKAGLAEARTGFFSAGRTLSPDTFERLNWTRGLSNADRARLTEQSAPIFDVLSAQGADLSYVLTTYNPNVTYGLDDPHSPHTYQAEGPLEHFIDSQTGL